MFKYIKILSVLSLSFLLFIIGCGDDNPVEPEETHFEAIGLYIISGGDTLVTYEAGVVSGEITVNQGDTTALLSVKFITEDGDIESLLTMHGHLIGKLQTSHLPE